MYVDVQNYGCGSVNRTFGILVSGCIHTHVRDYLCVHLVYNVGSQNTCYALIVPHISLYWPEDGLIRLKHVAPIKY